MTDPTPPGRPSPPPSPAAAPSPAGVPSPAAAPSQAGAPSQAAAPSPAAVPSPAEASRPSPAFRHPLVSRVAAIDCGTNSLRLLVADVGNGRLTDVVRRMEIVRLGQGVDRTGRLAPEALDRTTAVLRDYADIVAEAGASRVKMVATSATRDADNSAEFVRRVKEVLGLVPEVLTGDAEAQLSFTGATAELARPDGDDGPYLVTDIGGGSTEFVVGSAAVLPARSETAVQAISVDIGCVRMTERHLHSDPPAGHEVAAAVADIDAALDVVAAAVPVREARTLVGLAGSVTTVAAIAMNLSAYDAERIHHARVSAEDVQMVTAELLGQTRAQRAAIGVMHPGRVDVIGGGALILDRIMRRFGFGEVLVSEHDILDGIAWSLGKAHSDR
ncbi:MAG: Ppx/GppA family phosphatase [Streptosporangiaceae bacterium]|nr:Ppx/GppA family phosphatase [Streptosporangiaceae bacterium]